MNEQRQYSSEIQRQIRETADKQFAQIASSSPEKLKQAEAARSQLYAWLLKIDDLVKQPTTMVNDELVTLMNEALEQHLVASKQPEIQELAKAWGKLSDDQALDIMELLGKTILGRAKHGLMLSRQADIMSWEATGFHADELTSAVHVKVGNAPYQPIGFDDGAHYLGTQGSKLLWLREWAYAVIYPFSPAFVVSPDEVKPQEISDTVRLSDKERQKMEGWITLLGQDREGLKKVLKDKEAKAEAEWRIRESIKLLRIQLPRVDQRMMAMEKDHPEVGENFDNVPPEQLINATCEFMQMKLDDDSLRRLIDGTTVRAGGTVSAKELLDQAKAKIKQLIPAKGQVEDGEAINSCLSELSTVFQGLREYLREYQKTNTAASTLDGLLQADEWLDKALAVVGTPMPAVAVAAPVITDIKS